MRDLDEVLPTIMRRMEATIETKTTEVPLPAEGYEMLAELVTLATNNVFDMRSNDEWMGFMAGVMASIEMVALIDSIALKVSKTRSHEAQQATAIVAQCIAEALNSVVEQGLRKVEA